MTEVNWESRDDELKAVSKCKFARGGKAKAHTNSPFYIFSSYHL